MGHPGRTTFTSRVSFEDAASKAQAAGYRVVGNARNPNGLFVVFAEPAPQQRSPLYGKM